MDENQKELNKENKKIIKFNLNEHSVLNKIIQHPIIKHLASFFKSIGEDNISSYASEAALFTIISLSFEGAFVVLPWRILYIFCSALSSRASAVSS